MRWRTIALGCWGLVILSFLPAQAATRHSSSHHKIASHASAAHATSGRGGNCVAYAKAVTGIKIDGNAGLWWSHAAGRYDRGQEPRVGSVLVFKSFGHMRSGHVAVVSGVVAPRKILVDHANWIRGRITKAMAVVDTSSNNDWTSVKVLGDRQEAGGQRDNPTFGFIYPRGPSDNFIEVNADTKEGRHVPDRLAKNHSRPHREHMQFADAAPVASKPADDVKPVHRHRAEPH